MKTNKIFIAIGVAVTGVLMLTASLAVGHARAQTAKYIESSEAMARSDLADAARMLEEALKIGDRDLLNRAAGLTEAYLSRSGLEDCGGIYAIIGGICSGEYGIEICEELANAAKKALDGDGGAALRRLCEPFESQTEPIPDETTEDALSARVLKKLGRSADDVAERKAQAFCCPNAVLEKCESDLPESYIFSGDNIFIALEGKRPQVTMYCFDRELDERYTVTSEDAEYAVDMIVKKEKLKLPDSPKQTFENGIYRFDYLSENGSILVTFEIYSDTGRLRRYDAVNYYTQTK